MRLLFLSSTMGGGSGRSQRELAERLRKRGHDVVLVVDDGRPQLFRRWLYEQLSDASVRWADTMAARPLRWIASLPGRRARNFERDGLLHRGSPVPENALRRQLRMVRPEIVVGNSLVRLTWRRARALCADASVPTILYVREVATLAHLDVMDDPAEALLANAKSLADKAEARGFECEVLPSVIDLAPTLTDSTRRVVLMINPIESHGLAMLWAVASRLPDIPFVIHESWPLTAEQTEEIEQRASEYPNVELRRRTPPGPELYADARVLLVPHQLDNRPRVIAEAQANGIPALVSDFPGLREAAGPGGIVLPLHDADEWSAAIRRTWEDEAHYQGLCAAAAIHSARAEIDPELITERFEQIVRATVDSFSSGSSEPQS